MEGKEGTVGGNGVSIMRKEMRRKDNKESSSESNHSCLPQLKVAFLPLFFHSVIVAIYTLVWWAGYRKSHFRTE